MLELLKLIVLSMIILDEIGRGWTRRLPFDDSGLGVENDIGSENVGGIYNEEISLEKEERNVMEDQERRDESAATGVGRSVIGTNFAGLIGIVKERVSKGLDSISEKINQFLQYYKEESQSAAELESELSYIQDTLRSNTAAGQKLHLDKIRELTIQKINEKALSLKYIRSKLAGIIRSYADLIRRMSETERDIQKIKDKNSLTTSLHIKRSEVLDSKDKTKSETFFS